MNREQLAHVLRAAAQIVDDPHILVIGSQSLLATFDEDELPAPATASMEVDLAYLDDPDERKALEVDGAIGEWSSFHELHGIYAQGVSVATAILPEGWRERVVPYMNASTGTARAVCLDPHDCVVSKLLAQREKDFAFASALLEVGLIDPQVLLSRAEQLPANVPAALRERVQSWIRNWIAHRVCPTGDLE